MEARERLSRLDFVTHNAAHVITKGSHCTKTSPKQDSTRQAGTFAKSMIPKNRRQKSWKHHETDEPDVTLERMREEDIASISQTPRLPLGAGRTLPNTPSAYCI